MIIVTSIDHIGRLALFSFSEFSLKHLTPLSADPSEVIIIIIVNIIVIIIVVIIVIINKIIIIINIIIVITINVLLLRVILFSPSMNLSP